MWPIISDCSNIIHFRLVSAFTNKLNPGKPWYHQRYGKTIIRKYRHNPSVHALATGAGVTFQDFIKYIVGLHKNHDMFDEHWVPQHKLSNPCFIPYRFIGKFETLHTDMEFVVHKLFNASVSETELFKKSQKATDDLTIATFYRNIPRKDIDILREIYKYDFMLFNYSTSVPYLWDSNTKLVYHHIG